MQKRTVYSLLLISFIVVFAASLSLAADQVTVESKSLIPRCAEQSVNVTFDNDSEAKAVEFVFEIAAGSTAGFLTVDGIDWDADFIAALPDVIVDLGGVDGVSPDTIRVAAMNLAGGGLAVGSHAAFAINFTTSNDCEGDITISNVAEYVYGNQTGTITTQYVNGAAELVALAVNAGTVGMANQAPTISAIADATIPYGTYFTASAAATDPDLDGGCEELTYAKVSGPTDLMVNTATGAITWQTTGADVCSYVVEVKVVDGCLGEDVTSFTICVTNEAPVLTCPDDQQIFFGETLAVQATGVDPDGGPYPMQFSIVSFDGPGTPMINPGTGEITWATETDAAYTGVFTMCVAVSDSANVCEDCSPANADTCCFQIEVTAMAVTLECQDGDGLGVIQGQETTVSVDMLGCDFNNIPIAGYNFLITYDVTAMALMYVSPGAFIEDCGWEYFEYRFGPDGNCDGGCPTGAVRIVAMTESNNGVTFEGCYDNSQNCLTQLAELHFLVTNDRTLECQVAPIRFAWYECGDNTLSSVDGVDLIISRDVFDLTGGVITDLNADFPSFQGANTSCETSDKGEPKRWVDFYDGCIRIICGDDIDAPGDVNLNAIPYEIADAVMFTNYFVDGLNAFADHVDGSIAATDVNKDGITLSVADLVYLIRVVVGDALPYNKEIASVNVSYTVDNGVVSTQGDVEIGAAFVVVSGNVMPTLTADNMEMNYRFDGQNTRILVSPSIENGATGFVGDFLAGIEGDIVSLEMATIDGYAVAAKNVPTSFALAQNYPNPFNPTATIAFSLPTASEWTLTFYNVRGQIVETVNGSSDAGNIEFVWEASQLASGVYFYKLEAGDFTATKKAVLLK